MRARFETHFKFAAVACVGLLLSGCALASLGQTEPPSRTFDLAGTGFTGTPGKRGGLQLVVSEPLAVRALAGDRILVKASATEISYFGGAVWGDQLPKLLQARLIETIQSGGRFQAVGDSRDRIDADLELASDIRRFEMTVEGKSATAHVELFLKLIDRRTGRLVASNGFAAEAAAASQTPEDGVSALNAAMQALLPRITAWAGQSTRLATAALLPRIEAPSVAIPPGEKLAEPESGDDNSARKPI